MGKYLDRLFHRATERRWREAAQTAKSADWRDLRKLRDQARGLRQQLDQLILTADERLNCPDVGSTRFFRPQRTDWSWRPDLWRGPLQRFGQSSVSRKTPLDDQVKLFHDCATSEITFRQIRNRQAGDLAPFGLSLEVFGFDGSFLSLSAELPSESTSGMTRSHLMRLDASVEAERPVEVIARLNIQHGPNTEQIGHHFSTDSPEVSIEFDLAYANLNENRISKVWLDLIFQSPEMNRLVVRDLTLCRHFRAEL